MQNNLPQLQQRIQQTVLALPAKLGTAAVNWTVDSFQYQAWRGSAPEAWKPRSPKAKRNISRAILISTGNLRRSIRIMSLNGGSVTIGSSLPYAAAHNNGSNGTVAVNGFNRNRYAKAKVFNTTTRRGQTVTTVASSHSVSGHSRNVNMPKRQFMPQSENDSPMFKEALIQVIKQELTQFFN